MSDSILACIEELDKKAHVLGLALFAVTEIGRTSIPAGGWERELLPLHDLATEISVGLRDLRDAMGRG
jgi:hypothetical protein